MQALGLTLDCIHAGAGIKTRQEPDHLPEPASQELHNHLMRCFAPRQAVLAEACLDEGRWPNRLIDSKTRTWLEISDDLYNFVDLGDLVQACIRRPLVGLCLWRSRAHGQVSANEWVVMPQNVVYEWVRIHVGRQLFSQALLTSCFAFQEQRMGRRTGRRMEGST